MASRRGVLALTLAVPGWFYLIFLLIGLAVGIPAEVSFERAWRLQMGGVTVTGQVDHLWQGTQSCGNNDADTCTTYNVAYAFDPGTWRQTETSVSRDFFDTLQEGGPIAVRYVASDPTINEVEFGWTLFSGVLLMAFALVFGLTGFIPLRKRLRRAHQMITLRDTGVLRQAEVTGHEPAGMRVMGRAYDRLNWRDEAGVPGQSQAWPQAKLPPVGSTIAVYADPSGKLPAVWAEDCGPR